MLFRLATWLAGLLAVSSQDVVGSKGCTNSICVFSNPYLDTKEEPDTQVTSVTTDTVQFRTVEEPQVKNVFRRSSFISNDAL